MIGPLSVKISRRSANGQGTSERRPRRRGSAGGEEWLEMTAAIGQQRQQAQELAELRAEA